MYGPPDAVKVNTIRGIAMKIMDGDTLNRLIYVIQNQITSQAIKTLELFKFKVEIFQVCFLL